MVVDRGGPRGSLKRLGYIEFDLSYRKGMWIKEDTKKIER